MLLFLRFQLRAASQKVDFHSGQWNCFTDVVLLVCGPGFDSASNRNEYKESSLGGKDSQCIGPTALQPTCADCLESGGASTSWSPLVLARSVME